LGRHDRRRVDLAEVGDGGVQRGLDAGQGGPGAAPLDELAIEEERVGSAVDEPGIAGLRLEHHPGVVGAPAQHFVRAARVGDGDAGQADGDFRAVADDDEGVAAGHTNDAGHRRRLQTERGQRENENQEESMHLRLRVPKGKGSDAA
jgi:hypothetical protein